MTRWLDEYRVALFGLVDQYGSNGGGVIDETLVGYYSAVAGAVALLEKDGLIDHVTQERIWPLKDVEYRQLRYGDWIRIQERMTGD